MYSKNPDNAIFNVKFRLKLNLGRFKLITLTKLVPEKEKTPLNMNETRKLAYSQLIDSVQN